VGQEDLVDRFFFGFGSVILRPAGKQLGGYLKSYPHMELGKELFSEENRKHARTHCLT